LTEFTARVLRPAISVTRSIAAQRLIALRDRPGLHLPDAAVADPARRHIDDAREADLIVRVAHDAQVCQHILDFLAVVELHAARDLIGHAGAA
jgi:hypothetical protein